MVKDSVLKAQKILKQQFIKGSITKKEYKKELKWIAKHILSKN
jgi:uncharacterized membrane protein